MDKVLSFLLFLAFGLMLNVQSGAKNFHHSSYSQLSVEVSHLLVQETETDETEERFETHLNDFLPLRVLEGTLTVSDSYGRVSALQVLPISIRTGAIFLTSDLPPPGPLS